MHDTALRRTVTGRRLAAPVIAALFVLSACTGGGDGKKEADTPGGGFAPAPGAATCQDHQKNEPGTDYTSAEEGDTAKVFELLKHYTANGRKPYCDGKPPTDLDKTWAKLFLDFGADPGLVSPELGGSGQPPAEPMQDPEAVAAEEAAPSP